MAAGIYALGWVRRLLLWPSGGEIIGKLTPKHRQIWLYGQSVKQPRILAHLHVLNEKNPT